VARLSPERWDAHDVKTVHRHWERRWPKRLGFQPLAVLRCVTRDVAMRFPTCVIHMTGPVFLVPTGLPQVDTRSSLWVTTRGRCDTRSTGEVGHIGTRSPNHTEFERSDARKREVIPRRLTSGTRFQHASVLYRYRTE
jgi:hypothetical protein